MLFDEINSFQGKNSFLSNFYLSTFTDNEGREWPTVEHYYQAHKADNKKDFELVASSFSPGKAKRNGSKVKIRSDWNEVKNDIMFSALKMKFEQNPDLKKSLVYTGDALLIEGNTWGDTYWGYDINLKKGHNVLGKQLMILRDQYKLLNN
jgi:ribA/ribD-fused uncharacterized protein